MSNLSKRILVASLSRRQSTFFRRCNFSGDPSHFRPSLARLLYLSTFVPHSSPTCWKHRRMEEGTTDLIGRGRGRNSGDYTHLAASASIPLSLSSLSLRSSPSRRRSLYQVVLDRWWWWRVRMEAAGIQFRVRLQSSPVAKKERSNKGSDFMH